MEFASLRTGDTPTDPLLTSGMLVWSLSAAARARNSMVYADVACSSSPESMCMTYIGFFFHSLELSLIIMLAEAVDCMYCGRNTASIEGFVLYDPSVNIAGV
jgi:hypothetical protein